MIPRLLVPEKLSPVSAASTDGRRRAWTILDDRQVVGAQFPINPLETKSSIPASLPLDVLAERYLVGREALAGKLELPAAGETLLPSAADERMAVPVDARPAEFASEASLPIEVLQQEDLVTPDVFTTGQVQFLPKQISEPPKEWSWKSPVSSLVFHIVLVAVLVGIAAIVPHHEPTQAELEAASRNLGIMYLPGSMFNQPKAAPRPPAPVEKLHVDPNLLKKFAPEVIPSPAPEPVKPPVIAPKPARELPSAPEPQIAQRPIPAPLERPQPPRFDAPPKPMPDAPSSALKLPSAHQSLDDAIRGAAGGNRTSGVQFGGPMPRGGGGGGLSGGGGGGGGYMGGGVQMLTPDQGVDFNPYFARLVARVKQNWYSVMPESAMMGDRGRVIVDFKIFRDGTIQMNEPLPRSSSEKPPLDNAAIAALRSTSPFEPIPSAFNGPYIEVRFIFLYNLPLDAAQ